MIIFDTCFQNKGNISLETKNAMEKLGQFEVPKGFTKWRHNPEKYVHLTLFSF